MLHHPPPHHPVNRNGLKLWLSSRNTGAVSALGTWTDYSSLGHDAALASSATVDVEGYKGTGIGDYADITDSADYEPGSGSWSLSAIVRLDVIPSNDGGLRKMVASQRQGAGAEWLFGVLGTDVMFPFVNDGANTAFVVGATTFVAATWYHVVTVLDRSDETLRLYINGAEEGTPGDTTSVGAVAPSAALRVGGESLGSGSWVNSNWDGHINHLQIYQRVLSPGEIAALSHRLIGA